VMQGESADAIACASAAAAAWLADARPEVLLALVARVDIAPGSMTLKMDAVILAERIAIDAECINADALTSRHPFQLRKRGVETRIVMADTPAGQDETLIRNIARAHAWFERIKAGATFAEIAETEGTSKRRVQQMIDLAFLAPDIVRDVLDGRQPAGFTSDWCKTHELPSDWSEQRALVATL
jgi:site-specific DNA recombinase